MSGGRITYEDAMASLKAMFPSVHERTIVTVLQSNRGAMEPAVEQLLAMEVPDTSSAPPQSAAQPQAARPAHSQPSQRPRQQSQWRHPLPNDFLRIPGVGLPPLAGASPSPRSSASSLATQMERDAALAAMVQNELFQEQLRTDPEFAAYLRADPAAAEALGLSHLVRGGSSTRRQQQGFPQAQALPVGAPAVVYLAPGMPPVYAPAGPTPLQAQAQHFPPHAHRTPEDMWRAQQQAQELAQQQARAAAIQRQLLTSDDLYAPAEASAAAGTRRDATTGISGGSRPAADPADAALDAADGHVSTTGGGWLGAMRRRMETLGARFRRQQAVSSSTTSSSSGTAPSTGGGGGGWFGRQRGGTGYAALPSSSAAEGISGGGGEDGHHLLGGSAASQVDRTRLLDGSGFDGAPARTGAIEIELSEAGGAHVTPGAAAAPRAPQPPSHPAMGSLNGDHSVLPPPGAFVIDEEEDDDDLRLVGGSRGRQQHV